MIRHKPSWLEISNTTWNSRAINNNGRTPYKHYSQHNYDIIAPDEPTFFSPNHRPDILDIAILQNIRLHYEIETIQDLSSDHFPVLLVLNSLVPLLTTPKTNTKTDWPSFKKYLTDNGSKIPIIHNKEDLKAATNMLQNDIHTALEANTTNSPSNNNHIYDIPQTTKELIRQKRRAREKAQRTLDPADLDRASALQRRVRNELQQSNQDRWERKIREVEVDQDAFWKLTKSIRTKKTHYPPIHSDTGLVYTESGKAEAFARQIEKQCSPNFAPADDVDWEAEVEVAAQRIKNKITTQKIRHATYPEICKLIRQLPNKKAPGIHNIRNKMIKLLPRKQVVAILNIIDAILCLSHFPTCWKTAVIIMIPKKSKSQFLQYYRPISLLPALSKLTERIILTRLQKEIEEKQLLPKERTSSTTNHRRIRKKANYRRHLS